MATKANILPTTKRVMIISSPEEKRMLEFYRAMSPEQKKMALQKLRRTNSPGGKSEYFEFVKTIAAGLKAA